MRDGLAIIACDGALPVKIAKANPKATVITLAGVPHQMESDSQEHQIERLGTLFKALKGDGISRVVFAGSLARPALDPARFDTVMLAAAPGLLAAMQRGDDALLRQVIGLFEAQALTVVGAHELLSELTAPDGMHSGAVPDEDAKADIDRAIDILMALSPLDVGQGCVVAGGQCLGIETLQGTDALLQFVKATPDALKRGHKGVFVKAAKQGQDLRIDMPTIGPKTVAAIHAAGLAGIVIEAERVMILDRAQTLKAAEDAGIFLISRTM